MEPITAGRGYDFTLILTGVAEITTALEDALFEAGCDDATLGVCDGQAFLDFGRVASSFDEAVASALQDVQRAGFAATLAPVEVGH